MATRMQRLGGVLAVLALIGVPVAGCLCAIVCAPQPPSPSQSQPHAQPATAHSARAAAPHHEAEAAPAHHHHHAGASSHECCAAGARVVASVGATGCDTHGTPDRDVQATLTAVRFDTHSPSTLPVAVFDRASLDPASMLRTPSGYSPPPSGPSRASSPLVLRI